MKILGMTVMEKGPVQENNPVQESGSPGLLETVSELSGKITSVLRRVLPITITFETEWMPGQEFSSECGPERFAKIEPPTVGPFQEEEPHVEEREEVSPSQEESIGVEEHACNHQKSGKVKQRKGHSHHHRGGHKSKRR